MQAEIAQQGSAQDAATFQVLRERYGLDQPIYVQYLRWIQGWPEGDFGWSLAWNAGVATGARSAGVYRAIGRGCC
ncbi:MAG: hypothetical protein R2873_22185 [Caldilineaceae bacterium]